MNTTNSTNPKNSKNPKNSANGWAVLLRGVAVFLLVLAFAAPMILKPATAQAAAKTASVTGNWSATATWGGSAAPVAGDTVTINSGVTVTIDVALAECASITFNAPAAAGGITISGTNVLTVSGAVLMNAATAAFTTTLAVGTGTLNAGSITIQSAGTATYINQITVSTGTINCTGNFAYSNGSQVASAKLVATGAATITIGGDFTCATGQGTFTPANTTIFKVGGNWDFSGTLSNNNRLLLTLNGTGDQTILGSGGTNQNSFRSLTINKASGTATLGAAIVINNVGVTVTSGTLDLSTYATTFAGTLTMSSGTTVKVGGTGDLIGFGTFTLAADSNVEYYGTNQTLVAAAFGNLTLSGSGTKTGAGETVAGNLIVGSGATYSIGAFTAAVTGTTTVNGTISITSTTGTKTFTGNVTINNGGILQETVAEPISYGGNVTINSGGTLTESGAATQSFAGNLQNDGTYTASTGAHTFTGSGKTFGGTSTISIPSLTVSGAGSSYTNNGTLTVGTLLTVTSPGTITNNGTITATTALSGTGGLTQGTNSTLYIGNTSGITTLTATASGNTVIYDRANTQTVKPTTYANLALSGTSLKTTTSVTVSGVLSMEGSATASAAPTWSGTAYTLQYKGSAQQTTGSEFTSPFDGTGGVIINNSSGVILGAVETINTTLTLTAGTFTLTNALTMGNGATISRANGSLSTAPTFGTTVNVTYTGATSGVATGSEIPASSTVLNNLTINDSGQTVTLGSAPTVNGNLTITAGTLDVSASNYALAVKGNWSNSGTFTARSGAVTLNGSSGQAMTGATTFYDLTMNNSSGLTINDNETVSHTLTLTSGKITTSSSYSVIISSGGTVSGASTSSYIVGKLQKAITGTGTTTFEVGTSAASNYAPISVTLTAVTGSGTLTGSSTTGQHPNFTTAGIDSAKYVNRYWTLTSTGISSPTYNATFNFLAGDVQGGANTSNFIVRKYSSGWSRPASGTTGTTSTSTTAGGFSSSFGDYAIGEPPPWLNYADTNYTTAVDPVTNSPVYMHGTGLAYTSYNIAYYDASEGAPVAYHSGVAPSSAVLNDQLTLSQSWTAGAWRVLVQLNTGGFADISSTAYATAAASPDAYGLVGDRGFSVNSGALPEFPTAAVGPFVLAACFAIYYWRRKKAAGLARA